MKRFVLAAEQVLETIDKVFEWIINFGILFLFALGLIAVFFRYVLNHSLFWSDELLRYSQIWFVFIGAALGVSRKLHMSVDMVYTHIPKKIRYWLTLFSYMVMLIVLIVLTKEAFVFWQLGYKSISAAMGITMSYVYFIIPVCFTYMAIGTVRLIAKEYILRKFFCV